MTNEWSTPSPPLSPPPPGPAGGPLSPPTAAGDLPPIAVEPVAPKRSRGRVVAVLATVVAVGGAGAFAAGRVTGSGDEPQGADSADELGESTLDAFDQTDVLGAMDLLLPSERETYGEPLIDMVDELERLEVLADVDLSDINGVDVTLDNREVTVDKTNVGDIVHLTLTAEAESEVVGDRVPTGPILEENEIEASDSTSTEFLEVPLVGVERDGKWYLSLTYTAAEFIRQDSIDPDTGEVEPIPTKGITPHGASSPEGALQLLADATEKFDLEAIIAGINPREAEALQRYAPLFIDDAQADLDDTGVTVEFTELDTKVEGGGDTRQVFIEDLGLKVETEGEVVDILWADGCLQVEANDETVDFCNLDETAGVDTDEILEDVYAEFEDPEPVEKFVEALTKAFDDYEAPGITVQKVDGEWYASPVATGFDYFLELFHALDSSELRELIDLGEKAGEAVGDELTIEIGD